MNPVAAVAICGRVLLVGNKHVSFINFLKEADPDSLQERAERIAQVVYAVNGEENAPDEIITDIESYVNEDTPLYSFLTNEPGITLHHYNRLYRYLDRIARPIPEKFGRVEVHGLTEEQHTALQNLYDEARNCIMLVAWGSDGRSLSPDAPADGDLIHAQIADIKDLIRIKDTDEIREACRLGPDGLNDRLAIEQTPPAGSTQSGTDALFRLRTRVQCRLRLRVAIAALTNADIACWNYEAEECANNL